MIGAKSNKTFSNDLNATHYTYRWIDLLVITSIKPEEFFMVFGCVESYFIYVVER